MVKHVHSINDLMSEIGVIAYDKIKHSKNEEEYAFALGMLNVANVILTADEVCGNIKHSSLCVDYKETRRLFEEAEEYVEEEKTTSKTHQMSFEDMLPNFFEEIDKHIEKYMHKNQHKPNQQKSKKE